MSNIECMCTLAPRQSHRNTYFSNRCREADKGELFLQISPLLLLDSDIKHDGLFLDAFPRVHTDDGAKVESDEGKLGWACQCLRSPACRLDREARRSISQRRNNARLVYIGVRTKKRLEDVIDKHVERCVVCLGKRLHERCIHASIVDRIGQVI